MSQRSILFSGEKRTLANVFSDNAPGFGTYGGYRSQAGEPVNFATTIGLDTVAATVGLLSDLVYMIPFHGYTMANGVPQRMPSDPPLVASPSLNVDPGVWRAQYIVSLALWGNAYGLVMDRDRLGYPTKIEWLDPQRVTATEMSTIDRNLEIRLDGQIVKPDQIVHKPGRYVRPGSRLGMAPLERFRETFGLALAARNYGAKWFGDGGHPSSVLMSDQVLDAETANTIRTRLEAAWRGRRGIGVLGAGLKWAQVQTNPNESQFLETQNAAGAAVARAFGIPAEMIDIAVAGGMTYANREQRAIDFLTYHADPWLVRVEELVNGNTPRTQFAQFERAALLRTDTETKVKVIVEQVRGGILTVDEARRLMGLNPFDDGTGGAHLWPPFANALPNTDPTSDPTAPSGGMP